MILFKKNITRYTINTVHHVSKSVLDVNPLILEPLGECLDNIPYPIKR